MNKKKLLIAIAFSLIMLMSAFAVIDNGHVGQAAASSGSLNLSTQASNPQSSSGTAWHMPTTTMNEPGYKNATFNMGIDCNVGSLNWFTANTYCDVYVTDEVYDPLYNVLPDGASIPWLATGFTVDHVTSNNQTFDLMTNSEANYSYVYTVNLRPYVQWTDWSAANASQTYTFTNHTVFDFNGKTVSHTFTSFKNTTMKKYYLQSADVVLSWRLQSDFGIWPNVVNVIPNGNLSVKIFVTKQTVLFQQAVLANDILPYHIWVKHDFTSIPGLFNYTPGITPGNGYYGWDLGWNTATGQAPGLVGTGPFMVTNNYGMPQGQITPSHEEALYVNPHYFTQYANASSGLRRYTPKFYEIYMPFYSSASAMVAAYTKGQIETTSLSVAPNFEPQIKTTPDSSIYLKPSSSYGFLKLNTGVAPLNITAFRQALNYATPYTYINTVIAQGYGISSSSPINPQNTLYFNTSSPNYDFNMKKATSLIESIPGMANNSGVLSYHGTPVSLEIQTTVGAVAPNNIQNAKAICADWNALGIKTTLKEEAFTTLINNVDGTISSYNTTTGTFASNLYQIGEYGESTASGNPALDCQEVLNPLYGVPLDTYNGPFSNLTYQGKDLSGSQVQSLFNNLTSKLVNTNSQAEAEKLSKDIQTLYVMEAPLVILGYGTDIVPELQTFTNYSLTNTEAVYLYWYWQFFGIYENPNLVKVHYNYTLTVSASLNNATTEHSGDQGTVTFTVTNKTQSGSMAPVADANISIAVSAPYGGVVATNATAKAMLANNGRLRTNSKGQANYSYKVFSPLRDILLACNPVTGNNYNLYYEQVNITGYATVGNHTQTGPGNATSSLWLINPSLDVSYTPSQSTFTAGESGNITFFVSENGTGYAGATVDITPGNYLNMTYSSSELTLTTNSAGYAVFNFTVNSNVTGFYNATFIVKALSGKSSIVNTPSTTFQVEMQKKASVSSSATVLYAEIGGGVASAAVIIGVATYFIRKPKLPGPKGGDKGTGTSGQ